jgi:hypothetical protein
MPGFKCVKTVDTLIVLFLALNENEPAGSAICLFDIGIWPVPLSLVQFLIIYLSGRLIITYLPMSELCTTRRLGIPPIYKQADI